MTRKIGRMDYTHKHIQLLFFFCIPIYHFEKITLCSKYEFNTIFLKQCKLIK